MAENNTVLKELEAKISLKIEGEFNPQEALKKREGLYIWSDFKERILDKASVISDGISLEVHSFELTQSADDEAIEKSLPKKHLFTESEVCAVVAELISKQPKGEEGSLQNTGYANLFYTPAFVVGVRWYDDEWSVRTWDRDDFGWSSGGDRVFSPATLD